MIRDYVGEVFKGLGYGIDKSVEICTDCPKTLAQPDIKYKKTFKTAETTGKVAGVTLAIIFTGVIPALYGIYKNSKTI